MLVARPAKWHRDKVTWFLTQRKMFANKDTGRDKQLIVYHTSEI